MTKEEFADALERLGGSRDLLIATASIIAEDAPQELARLEEAINTENMRDIVSSAHTLRGMLSTFFMGGAAVTDLRALQSAAELEDSASTHAQIKAVRPHVLASIQRLRDFCSP